LLCVPGMRIGHSWLALLLAVSSACAVDGETDDPVGGKADSPDSEDNPAVPSGVPADYPIVLVHGFNASPERNGFGPEVVAALCGDGHAVFAPALPPFASVETRSQALAEAVDAALAGAADDCGVTPDAPPAKVNLIAHSMGGLDARFLVASLGYGDRVATVTTISTPHRGSAMADMSLGLLGAIDDDALRDFAAYLARPLGSDPGELDPDMRAAFTALAEATAFDFNLANPDDDRVDYESWAGLSNVAGVANPQDLPACEFKMSLFPASLARHKMHILLKAIAFVVAHRLDLRPNDGLVQVESAKWGTFRGCLPADHMDEVGAADVSLTPFDYIRFLRNRAFELADRGF